MSDWIITLPKATAWADYRRELEAVSRGQGIISYRVPYLPKGMELNDRVFVTWNGFVQGFMYLYGLTHKPGFTCETSGRAWPAGWYIERTGTFHGVPPVAYPGFRGIRKYAEAGGTP
jgi:hypothetical protein